MVGQVGQKRVNRFLTRFSTKIARVLKVDSFKVLGPRDWLTFGWRSRSGPGWVKPHWRDVLGTIWVRPLRNLKIAPIGLIEFITSSEHPGHIQGSALDVR